MKADLPHTLYLREKRKGGNGGVGGYKYNPDDPAVKKQMAAIRRRKERMEREGKEVQYTMDELFKQ